MRTILRYLMMSKPRPILWSHSTKPASICNRPNSNSRISNMLLLWLCYAIPRTHLPNISHVAPATIQMLNQFGLSWAMPSKRMCLNPSTYWSSAEEYSSYCWKPLGVETQSKLSFKITKESAYRAIPISKDTSHQRIKIHMSSWCGRVLRLSRRKSKPWKHKWEKKEGLQLRVSLRRVCEWIVSLEMRKILIRKIHISIPSLR